MCVLGLGFRLRPASPGWGVGVCVCSCGRSACSAPLLAGVCGVGVCAWVPGLAAPRHSWLRCWGVRVYVRALLVPRHSWLGCAAWVCLLGLALRLRTATPGWGVGVCVCWCARSARTPPLLARVCCVGACAWARVSAAPRLSWLGCWGVCVRAPLVPRHSWLGCSGVRVCVLARVSAAPRHSLLGFWGVRVFVSALRLYPATPGRSVRPACVCLGLGFGGAPPLLAGVLACVCAAVRVPLEPRQSWLVCWGVCVLGCALRVYSASPGRSVRRRCVCLGSGFGGAPPLLAAVLGCACAGVRAPLVPRDSWLECAAWLCVLGPWVSAAPRHSWLGCQGVCVLLCTLRFQPPTPGRDPRCWCVCLGSRCGCARHSPPGCLGVCVVVCALRFYLATPGLGVWRGCVCSGSGFGCSLPLLAGLLWSLYVSVRVPVVPHHSWRGCAVLVGVLGSWLQLRPATLGWGVRVCACALCLYPSTSRWAVLCGCICFRSVFGCARPLLAGVLGCVCERSARTPPFLAVVLGCACVCSPRAHLVPSFILPELIFHLKRFKMKILKLNLIHSAFIFLVILVPNPWLGACCRCRARVCRCFCLSPQLFARKVFFVVR